MKSCFKGKLISLFIKKVKLPNGHTIRVELIKHPGAALIVPFLAKDKVVLLRQYRPVIKSYIYELPAGTLKPGELPLECAKREIIEETGYKAKRFTKLGKIYPVPGYSTEQITIFKAEGLQKAMVCLECDEIIEIIIVDKKKARSLFKSGKLNDAKTICALAMCGWLPSSY